MGVLPVQGTDIAGKWNYLWDFLTLLSVFFFVLVVGGMIYFAFKYRERPESKTRYIKGNHRLDFIWTAIPLVLLLGIFGWGYWVYTDMVHAPPGAYEIRGIGKQWTWQFQYDNGRMTTNELYVPVNRPVKVVLASEDVLHGFFVPDFRIKQDVVPGMYTSVWFEATVPGEHQLFCTQYCGTAHSGMLAKVIALLPDEWEAWKKGHWKKGQFSGQAGKPAMIPASLNTGGIAAEPEDLVSTGKKLFVSKTCITCHSTGDQPGGSNLGPGLKGVFGSDVELQDGSKVKADENYIRESIEYPQAKVVKGFSPVMPTFKGQITEPEMNALIAYIKSLK